MLRFKVLSLVAVSLPVRLAVSQSPSSPVRQPDPPPATKLEAFKPSAGSVTTSAFEELGSLRGVSVEAREVRGGAGTVARGLLVEVKQGEYRDERAFIDADELSELIKGIGAIEAVKANPTKMRDFQVDYTTRGSLEVSAYSYEQSIRYAIRAGRVTTATQVGLTTDDLEKFRTMIANGQQRLVTLAAAPR